MYYVYILKSKKDKDLYIGSANDLKARFSAHNAGRVPLTKQRIPFNLVYYEAYKNEKVCRKRESKLKLHANAFNQLKLRIKGSLT